MSFFPYGEKEVAYLSKKCKKLGAYMEKTGMLERRINPDPFSMLTGCIISQQISTKAAATVSARLREKCAAVTARFAANGAAVSPKDGLVASDEKYTPPLPENMTFGAPVAALTASALSAFTDEEIQQCGMSMRKVSYIKAIAEAQVSGAVDFDSLDSLPDAEVIRILTAIRGVGVWTAEMLLIFSLCRPNILSVGDFGIRKGLMRLHGKKELTSKNLDMYRRRYSPYGSVASLYLWHLAGQG